MDEDVAGRIADHKIRAILSGKPYEISSLRQSVGKDWNDYLVRWRQIAEQCSTYPTTKIIGTPSGKSAGRIHYLNKKGAVITTEAFGNKNAYQHQIKRCFSRGQGVVAETSEQQERIRRTKAYRPPNRDQTKSVPEHDNEMEL